MNNFNQKVQELITSIEAEILINKNILKNFKPDLYLYQMIQNFKYFSSKKSAENYTNKELFGFNSGQTWLHKSFFIIQTLSQLDQLIYIEDSDNNKQKNINKNYNKSSSVNLDIKKQMHLLLLKIRLQK